MQSKLFKPAADIHQAYIKMGFYGIQGSGKSMTAMLTAVGLSLYLKDKTGHQPPVIMQDTETGAFFLKKKAAEAGVDFYVASTRSFEDAKAAILEAEKNQAILLIDSLTHIWEELKLSYAIKRKRFDNKLEMLDYATIKPEWQAFVQMFLTSKAHIIVCGRQANEYELEEKELDNGKIKKEFNKGRTKMKAEGEMGYEPALVVHMTSERSLDRKKKQQIIKAYIEKDRSSLLNGREFINPTFKSFLQHVDYLDIGSNHTGFDTTRTSSGLFQESTGASNWQREQKSIVIKLDEIQSLIVKHYPGQTTEEKKQKAALLETYFQTLSWEKIKTFDLLKLQRGYEDLYLKLEGRCLNGAIEKLDDYIPNFDRHEQAGVSANNAQTHENSQAFESGYY